MEQEIWKDIPGYEGKYQVSNLGNVKSLNYNRTGLEKILTFCKGSNGYFMVTLSKNKIIKQNTVHRLVAITFIPNQNNLPQVNHIDGNRLNNKLDNLEWCTSSENHLHKYNTLGYKNHFHLNHPKVYKGKFGKDHNCSKKVNQYDLQGNFIKTWDSTMDIQRELNIFSSGVSACCNGKRKTAGGFIFKYVIGI